MTDQDWRRVSQGLAVVLGVLVLAVIAVVVLRLGGAGSDGASPSGSLVALASESPSPSAAASPSPSPRPSRSPRLSPSPSAAASPSAEPSLPPSPQASPTIPASPTPAPTRVPAAPLRAVRFLHVGIDGPSATTPTPRLLTFASQGRGQVTATLGQTSAGNVRFCLYSGDQPAAGDCQVTDHTTLTASTTSAGAVRWHVSILGVEQATSPSANVKLEFRTNAPRVTVDGFRFQGTSSPDYNGITAQFKAGAGEMEINGSWAGPARPWGVALIATDSGETVGSGRGTGNSLILRATLGAGSYRLTAENTEEAAAEEVFLHAVLTWP
jgi:hypothetical protein